MLLNINVFKWCYFARSVNWLQSYVYIIFKTFKGMIPFTILMLMFTFCFSVMYMAAHCDAPGLEYEGDPDGEMEESFPGRYDIEKFLMFGIQNTVGDF